MKKSIFVLVLVITTLTFCNKDKEIEEVKDPAKDYMEYNNEGKIASGGGKITLESISPLKGASVSIPAGALANETKITVQVDNSKRPTGNTGAEILKLEPDGLKFSNPVTIKIPISNTITNPILYYFSPDSMTLQQVPIIEFNQTEGYIKAEINHFSRYYVDVYRFFDAWLYNSGSTIKAKVKFGGNNGLASVPVKSSVVWTSGLQIFNAKQSIDYGVTLRVNGTFPELTYGNIQAELLQDTKSIKSIKLAVQRKGMDPVKECWVNVRMVNPDNRDLFTSGILSSDAKENFFSGNALIFDFNTLAETGKKYYLKLSWCLSDNPWGWYLNRFTDVYELNTFQDPAWTTSSMINSDPDKNKNYVDDQYDLVPNKAPTIPSNPSPAGDAVAVVTAPTLSWDCSDPDNDPVTYDVYFGTDNPPTTKVSPDQTAKNLSRSGLANNTTYYWQVTAKDNNSNSTTGPVWSFTTAAAITNEAPLAPSNPTPTNNATSISITPTFSWACTDPENDPLTYDLYFGEASSSLVLISPGQTAKSFDQTGLTNNTLYFWQVIAKDNKGNSTPGPVWKFNTLEKNGTAPVSNFNASANRIVKGSSVVFTNTSTNIPTEYLWNFGDNSTSTEKSPTHRYSATGVYEVSLYVKNSFGSDTKTCKELIKVTEASGTNGTVTDIDGNVYKTVKIGNQVWMAENLETTRFRNGNSISNVTDSWEYLYNSAYTWYNYDKNYQTRFGAYYNFYAVTDTRGLCPSGWHVPTKSEWESLANFLGGADIAGGKLKETGYAHWPSPNTGATNEFGFSATPGEERSDNYFYAIEAIKWGLWWSKTEENTSLASVMFLKHDYPTMFIGDFPKVKGLNCRCILDSQTGSAPVADFTASKTTITKGETIQFTDKSTNSPTSWLWDFGDVTTSTEQNPSKTYNSAGNYTVTLKATNNFGNSTKTTNITVGESGGTNETSSFTDPRDGKTYKTVKIGNQWWMAENLAYLPEVYPPTSSSLIEPRYYVYEYTGSDVTTAQQQPNYTTYGVLYNWAAAKAACPPGWHLPTDAEWKQLEMALGMTQAQADAIGYRGTDQGTQMKATTGWYNNGNGTNTSGFSALPGGNLERSGGFFGYVGHGGIWLSSTETSTNGVLYRTLDFKDSKVCRYGGGNKECGWSVRCVRD